MPRVESFTVRRAGWSAPRVVPVGVRPFGVHNNDLGPAGQRYAVALTGTMPFDAAALEIAIPGYLLKHPQDGGPEVVLPNSVSVKAAVRVVSGLDATNVPVVWEGGGRVGTVTPGSVLRGVAAVPLPTGAQFTVALSLDPGSGQVPVSIIQSASDPGVRHAHGTSLTFDPDTWDGSSVVGSANEPSPSVILAAVPAVPERVPPGVCLLGDSITLGGGDVPTGWGYAVRALQGAGVPWLSGAMNGTVIAKPPWQGMRYRWQLISRYARWLMEMWGNANVLVAGLLGGTDASGLKADKLALWRGAARAGFGVVSCVPPPVRDPNNDATLNSRYTSIRTDLVTWLRNGAPWNVATGAAAAVGATGPNISRCLVLGPDLSLRTAPSGLQHPVAVIFDPGGTVEATPGANVWAAGTNADTLHPSTAGHQAMANAIATSVFRQEPPVYSGA